MKRFTMIVALLLMVAMPMMAERVSPETAQKVAQTFLNNNGAKAAQLTDLSKIAGFPNLYIFTAEPGFVVMAADDCVQPILGYSLTGNFIAENMPENVHSWLQGYSDEIQYAIDSKMKASAETAKQWKDLIDGNSKAGRATVVVDNLLTTIWDQDPYYNDMCPYDSQAGELTVTGCVATAMAQIMRYWEHPVHGTGSHSYTPETHPEYGVQSANFGNTTYNWDNMPNSIRSSNNDIAQLMYHCGVSVDMDYDISANGGSGAVTAYVANALTNYFDYQQSTFRYKAYYENSWVSMLKTELDNGRPLQYSGRGSGGGHSFVCCGYDSDDNFYFNWGWSGHNDGFYALNNLVPGSGGSGGAGYSFTQNQGAIFGIQPNTPSINPPTIATAVDGTNVTITWNEISDADSYRLYRNGNLIASSLTTTSYTDTDLPYGEQAYYVKSVKSDGTMSLKSNISVAIISFEGPVVTDLTATLNGNTVNLSWTASVSESAILQYGSANPSGYVGFSGYAAFYWAQRYPVATLASYAGMAIDKVSVYFGYSGTYTLYIYNGDETGISDLMYQTDYTVSSTGWKDINVTSILPLDYTSDLWVVMYAPQSIAYPAGYCSYSGSGAEDAAYYSSSGSGWYSMGDNTSWVMKTYISDGTFTYNLYDGTNPVASNIEGTSYTVSNIANNAVHQYTVKTNYYGGESDASNMAGLAIGTASLNSLQMASNDQMTVTEGSKLTVSETLSDVNSNNLILENGAQLVHNSEGVMGTVKKNITPYSSNQNDGWNLLASPVIGSITPSADNGLLANNYDLYLFDQSEELEWRNYEANSFAINHKTGYLYANSVNTTLTFAGTLAATTDATTLDYNGSAAWKGFNLIGNPYPCEAYVNRSFYVVHFNNGISEFTVGSNPTPPCSAVLVQAQGTGESVIFSKSEIRDAGLTFTLKQSGTRGNSFIDKAKISFNENDNLLKYNLNPNSNKLYIPKNGQDFAVAYSDGESEMPLSFKAAQDGTYTLSFEVENIDLDYLHLIDNLTGNDVDLLATPNYTFEATTRDYASRFRLVFAPEAGTYAGSSSDSFGFVANGKFQLVGGQGDLQIVDLNGRILRTESHTNTVDLNGLSAGVYFVRLISDNEVHTMKVVVD